MDNKPWTTYWEKNDFAGFDMFSVWTTSAYHSKHCTGRYQGTRERPRARRWAQSTKTYKRWGSPGRKQRLQLLTDTDGVGVWPAQSAQFDAVWIKVKVNISLWHVKKPLSCCFETHDLHKKPTRKEPANSVRQLIRSGPARSRSLKHCVVYAGRI